jgi:hypothetical protein
VRWVVVLLCGLLWLPGVADAGKPGAVWHRAKYVRVRAYVGSAWQPFIAQGVADMNAILPQRAPQLMLETLAPIPCKQARKKNARKRRILVVCENPEKRWPDSASTLLDTERGTILSPVIVTLGPAPNTGTAYWDALVAQNTVCHELMHAVAGAPENVGSASCVSGPDYLNTRPGADDIAFLQRVYRKRR